VRRWLSLALLLSVSPAAAAVVRETSVEDVARTSDAVVRGRVERRTSRWSGDGRRIVTDVEVRVTHVWRGSAGERVHVMVPGGEVGEIGQRVDAAPVITDGEEVVLFLVQRGGVHHLNGLALGKYRVDGSEAAPDLGDIDFETGPIRPAEKRVSRMPMDELERRVRAAK
jgi:hypothetical protein